MLLKRGSAGAEVRELQRKLQVLDYLDEAPDGAFGPKTESAVKRFQSDHGLEDDGLVGPLTLAALAKSFGAASGSGSEPTRRPAAGRAEKVPMSEVRRFFKRGGLATVVDVDTGLSYRVQATSVDGFHADVSPRTAADTEVLRTIYGLDSSVAFVPWCESGAVKTLWKRRAIFLRVDGDPEERTIAASQHGCPHGRGLEGNGYPGHFCIHCKDSRTHGTRTGQPKVDPDHQKMVDKAAGSTL